MRKKIITAMAIAVVYNLFFLDFDTVKAASNLSGRILLQVESKGEAWYVDPATKQRVYLGKPSDALGVMRKFGIGILDIELRKIPISEISLQSGKDSDGDGVSDEIEWTCHLDRNNPDSDGDGFDDKMELLNGYDPVTSRTDRIIDEEFSKKHAGKIFLQVQNEGAAWYINPEDYKRYYLGKPADAFNIMRLLGLGITNNDLNEIAVFVGELNNKLTNSIDNKGTPLEIKNKFAQALLVGNTEEALSYVAWDGKESFQAFFDDVTQEELSNYAKIYLNAEQKSISGDRADYITNYEGNDFIIRFIYYNEKWWVWRD